MRQITEDNWNRCYFQLGGLKASLSAVYANNPGRQKAYCVTVASDEGIDLFQKTFLDKKLAISHMNRVYSPLPLMSKKEAAPAHSCHK